MAESPYTDDQLILAARLYFLDGMPQSQIARLVNVSQSKVSRMLALARDRGIVRITVPEYDPRAAALERELHARFSIDAVVVRAVSGSRIQDLRQTVGYFAAPAASRWVDGAEFVAVAGGRTMQALAEHMKPGGREQAPTVLQAMGNIDSSPGPYDAAELGRALARRWQGSFLALNTPAILPDAETCKAFLGLEQIRAVMTRLAAADLVFIGIGTLGNSVFIERKALTLADLEALRRAGAVGEALGRFYDACGRECDTPLRTRVVSMGLDELRRVKRRVGVLAGTDRTGALLAAIRGGLVNTVVIDEGGASALLEAL